MRGTRARVAGSLVIALSAIAAFTPSADAGRMLPGAGTGSSYQFVGSAAGASPSVTFSCQMTTPAGCYGPAQIQAAYDFAPLYARGIDGTGRTIVIVDAFQSPTIAHDLQLFDAVFGLPDSDAQHHRAGRPDAVRPDRRGTRSAGRARSRSTWSGRTRSRPAPRSTSCWRSRTTTPTS